MLPRRSRAHEHGEGWAPPDGFERTAFTLAANVITGIGFALLLIAVSELAGGIVDWRQGVFWGLAGLRRVHARAWSRASARASGHAGGRARATSGLVGCHRSLHRRGHRAPGLWAIGACRRCGVALLVAPHIIGAPQPVSYDSPIPENLHHSFVVAVVLTTLVFWVLLGGLTGYFRRRFVAPA